MDTTIELSEAEKAKIKQNEQEELLFRKNLHSLINGDKRLASRPLVIGKTTNILAVCGADENLPLTITKKVIEKSMRPEIRDTNGNLIGKTGHNLSEKQLFDSLSELKNPAMVLKSKNNSIVIVTTLYDDKNRNIIIPIDLSIKEGRITVNSIRSSYGRDNFSSYIEKNYNDGNILAINKEKANEIFQSIGKWYPKEETFISFDNSIAYSTANVKYKSENSQNISEEEKFPSGDKRSDNMAETTQQELLERIAALEKQVSAMTAEQQNLKEQINTVNQFISSITESQNFEQSMSTIESMGKQVLDCGKAEFWCYDGAENKYFTNDENRGGRDWQIAKENMRIAADTKEAYIADGEAYIPIISNDKVAGILVASEKDGAFDRTSLEKFAPNGQIANTIDLSLKKEFEHQGRITDELTRLKNRQGAKEYAANTMAHNVNAEKDMCLIMCDIDHFKSINDTYGHDAGDTVLKNVAGILQGGTRQGADSAFRWGGEEMVCVMNCDYDHAMDIAERLRQQIESTTHLVYNAEKQPVNVGVTISMGVYQVKPDKEITQENAFSFFEEQLKFADALAYEAKETGRNKVVGEYDIMQEKNIEQEFEYAKAFKGETCIAYALDKNNAENSLIAVAETTIYGGTVNDLTNDPKGVEDKIYNDISKGRDSEAIESAKYAFENSSNNIKKDDLCFSKSDNGTYAVWNKNEAFDNAYVLIADGSAEKPLEFYKNVSEDIREYIVSTLGVQEKENYSIFLIDNGIEKKYFRDDNTDVNALVQRLADGNLTYPEISKNCTEISEVKFAELEQNKKNPPAFGAEINLNTKDIVGDEKPMELTVWDNDKTATINLDEAIQSIKESGTVNLDYQKFAGNNDREELTSEYLDFSQHLDNVYDDFLYRSGIYNSEHINYVDEHGELPPNLNSPENRAAVSEYLNIQLESGENLSERQKSTLAELKNQLAEIEKMEAKLGVDKNDLKFIAETKNMKDYADEVREKYDERNAGLDEQDRDDSER